MIRTYTTADIAAALQFKARTIASWIRTGKRFDGEPIRAQFIGGEWRIPASELDRLLQPVSVSDRAREIWNS